MIRAKMTSYLKSCKEDLDSQIAFNYAHMQYKRETIMTITEKAKTELLKILQESPEKLLRVVFEGFG